ELRLLPPRASGGRGAAHRRPPAPDARARDDAGAAQRLRGAAADRHGASILMRLAAYLQPLLPNRHDYAPMRSSWRPDLLAGLTVGIVALPLALAFGVSSGVSAEAGLVTAIVAGLVAAIFGGSPIQVSGPTGAMVVVLAPIVAQHG